MKKIIKLTENDLVRIVKQVINESGEKPANSCGELDGKMQHEVRNMTQRSYLTTGKGSKLLAPKDGVNKGDYSKEQSKYVTQQDPYAYVQLFNGKYCVTKPIANSDVYGKWTEVNDSKQKAAVWNILQKNPTPEFLRGA